MSYIKKGSGLIGLILLAWSIGCHADTTTKPISYPTANSLLIAVSKIRLSKTRLLGNLQYCGETFPHLRQIADKAQQQWLVRNQPVLAEARRVSTTIFDNVKQTSSAYNAEKMVLDIDALVSRDTELFMQQFKDRRRKEQHYLCNRLILSIPEGDHDLVKQNPSESTQLREFKP